MQRNNLYIATLTVFLLCPYLSSQPFTNEVKNILEVQDTRNMKRVDVLYNYLNLMYPDLVNRSLIALANIADSNTINYVNAVLVNSTKPECRKTAAFAMGQIPGTLAPLYLSSALDKDTDEVVIASIIEALGKTGDESLLNKITSYSFDDNIINSAIAYSIDKFARRHIINNNAVEKLSFLIHTTGDTNVLRNSAAAFFSILSQNFPASAGNDIIFLTGSDDPDTRMKAFGAIGFLHDTSYTELMLNSLKNDNDWRVRVNILYSIGKINDPSYLTNEKLCNSLLDASYTDDNDNVRITALQVLGKLYEGADSTNVLLSVIRTKLKEFMTPYEVHDWQLKAEAIKTYARIFKDKIKDELLSYYSSTTNFDIKAAIIDALGYMDKGLVYKDIRKAITADIQKMNEQHMIKTGEMIDNKDLAKLYRAFTNTMFKLINKVDTSEHNTFRLIFTEFLGSKDPALINTCMEALMLPVFEKYRNETAKVVYLEFQNLEYPKDRLAMIILTAALGELKVGEAKAMLEANVLSDDYELAKESSDALEKITGENYDSRIKAPKYRTDFDWNYIDNLSQKKLVLISTNQGNIKIELFPNEAPFTVQNFLKLAEKGYYDGIIFHRVVPNFVIQCGDPTGTGFGGPGYSIRTEISQLKFGTGTLGMASSGKDTEGSQFFITHSPQPHLDGKYTVFGKVISGMDVVDRIHVGDYIERIVSLH
jgi:cyclophilin family peptidyl-prolyl cis-trans isomerase/HEAT repeat protein